MLGVAERHAESEAIGWAFAEADRRGRPLVAVHAVNRFGAPRQEIGEQMELTEALAGWEPKYPGLEVVHRVMPQAPSLALVASSADASLVVVGARRRHGHIGMTLGRVNHAVLHYADALWWWFPNGEIARTRDGSERLGKVAAI